MTRDTRSWHRGLTIRQSIISPDHCSRRSSTLPPNLLHYSSGKFPQWSWQHYHYWCVLRSGVGPVTRGGIRRITKRLILRLFTHMSINPPSPPSVSPKWDLDSGDSLIANYSSHLGFDFLNLKQWSLLVILNIYFSYFIFFLENIYTKVGLSRKRASQMLVAIFRPKYLHPLAVKNDWCGEIKINTFTHNLAKREGDAFEAEPPPPPVGVKYPTSE